MEDDWVEVSTDAPCTGCGHCCKQLPCELADGHNPCLSLEYRDGRYWCQLVDLVSGVREQLQIGLGCGATIMPRKLLMRIKPDEVILS